MILADQVPLFVIVGSVAILISLGFGALFLFRGYEFLARRSLGRIYADFAIHAEPQPGEVILNYHTYHGLLAWFTQTQHRVALPPADARKLLGRLFRFNLLWGLVTFGALLILPLAILNYFAQRRSIAAQEAAGGGSALNLQCFDSGAVDSPDTAGFAIAESPSLFHRFIGWILTSLCIIFGIVGVARLVTGDVEGAIGGVVTTAIVGWVARDWLDKNKSNTA